MILFPTCRKAEKRVPCLLSLITTGGLMVMKGMSERVKDFVEE